MVTGVLGVVGFFGAGAIYERGRINGGAEMENIFESALFAQKESAEWAITAQQQHLDAITSDAAARAAFWREWEASHSAARGRLLENLPPNLAANHRIKAVVPQLQLLSAIASLGGVERTRDLPKLGLPSEVTEEIIQDGLFDGKAYWRIDKLRLSPSGEVEIKLITPEDLIDFIRGQLPRPNGEAGPVAYRKPPTQVMAVSE